MTHVFRLPIGDWSGDGHSQCTYYTIESNLPLEEVRDIYWDATVRLGVALDERHKKEFEAPCGNYEQDTFTTDWLEKAQLTLGEIGLTEKDVNDGEIEEIHEELFVTMFIAFVNKHGADKGVKLKQVKTSEMFPFYGYDDKKRHIGNFGYGLFN